MTARPDLGRSDLPTGTVTFLRTDVQGSMALARALGARWDDLNRRHLELIGRAVAAHGGVTIRTEGDALFAAFPEAIAAVEAAAEAQRAVATEAWPDDATIRVRIGLHTGEAHRSGDDYGGFDVNRAARVAAVGHGGQVVLSETTATLVADALPEGTSLRDLGRHVLKDVPRAERLSQLDIAGLPNDFPPLRSSAERLGNLPDRLTSFVGRDQELADLVELAQDARLVTLTGPGGIGKTSLAIEAARLLEPRFRDGAWFVSLAALDSPDQVRAAIAHGIGIFDGPERSAASAVLSFIADRAMILVLDNMEHILAAADEVAAVVHASPASRIIVTSRAPLRIAGEHEVAVASLVDDGPRSFTDRARAVQPAGSAAGDAEVVAEICHLLDDLPLGIELAAARVAALPPTVIRDRLAARLPLPGSGPRDAPARQRTLDGAVAWSHDLLPPDRQEMLHRLGVFEGGFDLEQVDAVVGPSKTGGDHLDALLELADQSLIVAAPTRAARARFRMLRTIQSFALDRLAQRRHRSRRSSAPRRGLSRPRDPGESSAEHVPSQRMARSHGARAGQPSSGGALVDRCRGGRPRPSSDRGPVAVLAGLRTGGRWSAACRGGAGDARGADQRIRPRVGAGRGGKSRLLAGRLGDGPSPLPGSDRRRRGGRRRGVHRRCVLQLRPCRVQPRCRREAYSSRTSTRPKNAIGSSATSAVRPEQPGAGGSSPSAAARGCSPSTAARSKRRATIWAGAWRTSNASTTGSTTP